MADAAESFYGQQGLTVWNDEHNIRDFHIRQVLAQVRTTIPVKVIAIHGGGVGAAPMLDVQPMINQTDLQGNKTDHGVIFSIPMSRNQGGGNAIINDPKVGDIGHMHVSDRDISALKANAGAQSNPGSFRKHDLADGVYVGAMLNPANPDQYVQFTDNGVKVVSKGGSMFEMSGTTMTITGDLHVTGDVVAGTISLQNHVHSGIQVGPADTGPPVP